MRRLLISLFLSMMLIPLGAAQVAAQEATPEPATGLAGLGLPELNVTVTADAYEGIPDSLEAGRYLVTVTATEDVGEFGGGVGFVQPVDVTVDEFLAALAGAAGDVTGVESAATPMAGATPPQVEADATSPQAVGTPPAMEEEMGELPPFLFTSRFAGGAFAEPGESAQVVLDLTPGEWIAWGEEPGVPWAPVSFTVTGEMPEELPEPEASATLIMAEYIIQVSEGELRTGPQVIRVDNVGAQPHFVIGVRSEVPITEADIEAILEADLTGTPPANEIDPETDFVDVLFTGTQSTGTSQWVEANLEPGTHILICFFPDLGDGMPHAFHGMYTIVEVSE
jgi:hypothetical protein